MHADDAGPASFETDVAHRSDLGSAILNPLLRMAIITGVEAAVALHISRGDDLNARDSDGYTPLMLCALRNRPRVCKHLLAAGANPDTASRQGKTAHEIALERGATEVAELLATRAPKPQNNELVDVVKVIDKAPGPSVAERVGEYTLAADLDAWEAEDEHTPPQENPEIAQQAALIHDEISRHAPLDLSAEWADIDAYLPELAQAPTRLRSDDDVRSALRLSVLRALREGSVPDMDIEDIAETLDIEGEHDLVPHLRRIIGDIGAETDERFEYVGPDDNFKVHVEQEATEQEDDVVTDVLMRLDAIVSRRDEPLRLYLRSIQRHALLSAAEELQLGQAMDSCLQQAVDLVATDDDAARHVLDAVRDVQGGVRKLGSISRGWNEHEDEVTAEATDDYQRSVVAVPLGLSAHHCAEPDKDEAEDVDEFDRTEGAQLDSIVNALEKHLTTETLPRAEAELRDIFRSLRLSAGFLSELADTTNERWQSTTSKIAFRAAMQRYRQAHDRMITSNLKLVYSIAKRYVYSGLPMEDLIQEGNLGLIKAVERYDWRRGFRFSTFATWWIRQQVGRSVADSGRTVRLPVHMHEKVQSLRWMIRKYEAAHGKNPSLATMAEAMSLRVDKVAPLLTYMEGIVAIDSVDVERLADPDFIARFHSAEPEDAAMANEGAVKVVKLLDSLPRNQQNVLRLRYGIGVRDALTLEEVGQGMGVTRERVRQIESKTLRMLQNPTRVAWLDGGSARPHTRHADQQISARPGGFGSQGPCSHQDQPSENADLHQVSECNEPHELKQQESPLDKALSLAQELGIAIEDLRSNGTGHLWVRITSLSSVASYSLIKQLRALGFQEAVGRGYWK